MRYSVIQALESSTPGGKDAKEAGGIPEWRAAFHK